MAIFDESKRYKFSKARCMEWVKKHGEEWGEETEQWTSECDGQEVKFSPGRNGTACGMLTIPSWCEELIPHMTAIVQEVCQQRYKKGEER